MNINNQEYMYLSTLINNTFNNIMIDINNQKNNILENLKDYFNENSKKKNNKVILQKKLINNKYYYLDNINNLIYNHEASIVGKIIDNNYHIDI